MILNNSKHFAIGDEVNLTKGRISDEYRILWKALYAVRLQRETRIFAAVSVKSGEGIVCLCRIVESLQGKGAMPLVRACSSFESCDRVKDCEKVPQNSVGAKGKRKKSGTLSCRNLFFGKVAVDFVPADYSVNRCIAFFET